MPVTQAFDFLIQWHLTERCNLHCRHCYQEGRRVEELPLEEIIPVIEAADAMVRAWEEAYNLEFSPSFNVTGGEPFLRPDFFTILGELAQTGFDLFILSNGTLITPEIARRVADLGIKGVQVSLEGPEAVHEDIRGRGSFAAALEGVRHLLEAGVTVSLNATLSRFNAPYFMDLVEVARSQGVPRLGFSRLVPSGRGLNLLDQMLSTAEVKELYEQVLALEVEGLKINCGDPLAAQMGTPAPEDEGDIPLGGCAAGVSGFTILADGWVTPCRRLPIPVGNVRRDNLRELWAAAPVFAALRDRKRYAGKCRDCLRWANCRGCRAMAYAASQARGAPDFLSDDPQCFIFE